MKTAVIYHRVSTLDQDPTLARDELRRAASARGLELLAEIEETGSGARNDRPGLAAVLELAARARISHVLVWKLDRFGRSALDVLANIEALDRAGVTFVATTQGLETGPRAGAMGKLVATVLAAIAEFERELIRERTRLGHAAARKKGVHIGRPPVAINAMAVARAQQLRGERGIVAWPTLARLLAAEGWGVLKPQGEGKPSKVVAYHPKTLARAVRGTKPVAGYMSADRPGSAGNRPPPRGGS